MENEKSKAKNPKEINDTTPKVTGIGGVFFFSENPEETKEWYAKNLGLEVNEWGSSFYSGVRSKKEVNILLLPKRNL
jgi:catechol-2,3-dioxygenase